MENSCCRDSGKVYIYGTLFSSTRAIDRQKRGAKSLEKKQFDFRDLLRKHKKTAEKEKQSIMLCFLIL
jgi:hypothetical protein